jgi:hypothetical protein
MEKESRGSDYLKENPLIEHLLQGARQEISTNIETTRSNTQAKIKELEEMRDKLAGQVDETVLQQFDKLIHSLTVNTDKKVKDLNQQLSTSQKTIFHNAAIDRLLERIEHPSNSEWLLPF